MSKSFTSPLPINPMLATTAFRIREWSPKSYPLRAHVGGPDSPLIGEASRMRRRFDPPYSWQLRQISAGGDLFSTQFNGSNIAAEFAALHVSIRPANTNRVQGWAEIQQRLGDPALGLGPTLFIHERCRLLLDTLPYLQHDPDHPADILKTNVNEEGLGGDDAADALRYVVATHIPKCAVVRLRGL